MRNPTGEYDVKLAYLILAHSNPLHFRRLMGSLSSAQAVFFVHVDRKAPLTEFPNVLGSNAHYVRRRVAVYWGDFSIVDATLRLIGAALSSGTRFDYLVLLSGADYPLRSSAYIESFFERNPNKEFMNIVQMPSVEAEKPISRLSEYRHHPADPMVARRARRFLTKVGILPETRDYRRVFGDLLPYAGSTWWALSFEVCQHIFTFVDENPGFVRFFRHTTSPAESFFQTIVGNSPYRKRVSRNITYTDWSEGKAHPAIISERHVKLFASAAPIVKSDIFGEGEVVFARKFSDASGPVVKQIDALIEKGAPQLSIERQGNDW